MSSRKAYSAPGKALLAGGYLVLDPAYNSYVTALSARMHVVIEVQENESDTEKEASLVKVVSPQFEGGEWEFRFNKKEGAQQIVESNGKNNPFLQATVSTVIAYINPTEKFNLHLTIFSDPGYHSQENTRPKYSINGKRKFLYHAGAINEVAKTGLGSSAGLVVVVTTALLNYFKPAEDGNLNYNTIHNVAQISHCYAQKKIGSGFDVAAAVYGSIIYRRFQPSLIENLLQHPVFTDPRNADLQQDYALKLQQTVDSNWDFNHAPCTLPAHIRLLMGDIQGGSETPKLVSKILKWKKDKPEESEPLYRDLNNANESLIHSLAELHQFYTSDMSTYLKGIAYLSENCVDSLDQSGHPQFQKFFHLTEAIKNIRSNLRKLTELSGAAVEPKEQTKLLDDCNSLHGSLGGVVPGAGGYDAISLLVVDDSASQLCTGSRELEAFKQVTWLTLQEEQRGTIAENYKDYLGL
ncbi:hypothetical protein G9P44_001717 [Scheffersomyces stipitis]|nr:hypothetical protein G9P44_001717 [Scheffersomyces stipitis]